MNKKNFVSFDLEEIPYLEYEKGNKKKILILHDICESIDYYKEMANYLNENFYDVYILEYRFHGELNNGEILDLGDKGLTNIINDMKLFIKSKFSEVDKNDLIIISQGVGSIINLYLMENLELKNNILLSVPIEKRFIIFISKLITNLELKIGIKNSILNKYIKILNREFGKEGYLSWLSRDKKEIDLIINDEKFQKVLSPKTFNSIYKLIWNVKKNIKKIKDYTNIYILFGTKDMVVYETKLRKYMQKINNGKNKIKFLKIKDARHLLTKEINRKEIFSEIVKYLKNI